MELHFLKGEKCLEFVKCACLEKIHEKCDFCTRENWTGPPCSRIPAPVPDSGNKYKYRHVNDTPLKIDGKMRDVDDFQPRKQIKIAVLSGTLSLDDENQMKEFCDKYIVDKELVITCVENIRAKKVRKEKNKDERKRKSENEKGKTYHDFNWVELYENDTVKKLLVCSLNKYLLHHRMASCLKMSKKSKADIALIFCQKNCLKQSWLEKMYMTILQWIRTLRWVYTVRSIH